MRKGMMTNESKKNKVDMLASLLAELEPADYEALKKQSLPIDNLVSSFKEIEKLIGEQCSFLPMIITFQLGYMIGKREERMKHKISKA